MAKGIGDFEPNLTLGDLIQLFVDGNDDKIYIDINIDYTEISYHCIRIIDPLLCQFYNYKITCLQDPCNSEVLLVVNLCDK